jgi:hypothetical protein
MICYFRSNKPVLQRPIEPGEFTASLFALACGDLGVTQSMGRVGSCFDNAAIGYAGLACAVSSSTYSVRRWDLNAFAHGHFTQFALAPQAVYSNPVLPGPMGLLGTGTLLQYSPVVIDYIDGELLLGPLNREAASA